MIDQMQPKTPEQLDEQREIVEGLVGPALFEGELLADYDLDDLAARNRFFANALQIARHNRPERTLDEIELWSSALNRLQAYVIEAEEFPDSTILRDGQIPIMRQLADYMEWDAAERRGGYFVLPTSTGKTVIYSELIHATQLSALVVAPTKELLFQTRAKFDEQAEGRDISVGLVYGAEKNLGNDVTITTYASLMKNVKKPKGQRILEPDDYDLVIFDEGHELLGEKMRKMVHAFPHAIKIACTATDEYHDEKKLSLLLPHEIARMNLIEAQTAKMVAPHHNIIVQTTTDMKRVPVASTGDFAQDILYETINTDERNQVIVDTYIEAWLGKKGIAYCGGIQHAKDLAAMFNERGVPAAAVWGDMPMEERRKTIAAIRSGDIHVITNANLLVAGFDVQSLEVALMAAPTLSTLRLMQTAGRVTRLWEYMPTKVGYVVQFIDTDYSQPPIIFAEEGASSYAQHGWAGFEFKDFLDVNFPYPTLTNPQGVQALALKHSESRHSSSLPPPQGWINFDELNELSGKRMTHLKNAYKRFDNEQKRLQKEHDDNGTQPEEGEIFNVADHSGTFLEPVKDGKKKRYISPELLEAIQPHIKQFKVWPGQDWRRADEVAEIYDKSTTWVNNSVLWLGGRGENQQWENKFVMQPDSEQELLHFHVDLIRTGLEKGGDDYKDFNPDYLERPPEHFVEIDELIAEHGELAISIAQKRNPPEPGRRQGPVRYQRPDGEVYLSYSPAAIDRLLGTLKPHEYLASLQQVATETTFPGITEELLIEEGLAVAAKAPDIPFYKFGLYYDDNKQLRYYCNREMLAHILERTIRRLMGMQREDEIVKTLEAEPMLVQKPPEIIEDDVEPDDEEASDFQEAPAAETSASPVEEIIEQPQEQPRPEKETQPSASQAEHKSGLTEQMKEKIERAQAARNRAERYLRKRK